jgi:hypothetical protein
MRLQSFCYQLERCSSGAKPGELKARRGIPDCSLEHTPQEMSAAASLGSASLSNSTDMSMPNTELPEMVNEPVEIPNPQNQDDAYQPIQD